MKNLTIKKLMYFFIGIFFISCSSQETIPKPIKTKAKIIAIDSTENTYIIYSKKDSMNIFRILSPKQSYLCQRKKIELNKEYKLNLQSLMGPPMTSSNIGWINYNGSKFIIKDNKSSKIIYISKNIKGLCYEK